MVIQQGDAPEICYEKTQKLWHDEKISSMFLNSQQTFIFNRIKESLPLYSEFQVISANNRTIGFSFNKEILTTIQDLSFGIPLISALIILEAWSHNLLSTSQIKTNMIKSEIADLLHDIYNQSLFMDINFTEKDLQTGYDSDLLVIIT
ncbi:MAG: hypothetical protein MI922_13665 [Bacteroidales bacterium]|nr:hypothetical protein [Bacteroidales bacterium]